MSTYHRRRDRSPGTGRVATPALLHKMHELIRSGRAGAGCGAFGRARRSSRPEVWTAAEMVADRDCTRALFRAYLRAEPRLRAGARSHIIREQCCHPVSLAAILGSLQSLAHFESAILNGPVAAEHRRIAQLHKLTELLAATSRNTGT